MQNPIERLCEELGLSLARLALALNVSYPSVWWLKEGMPVSIGPKVRTGLAGLQCDPVALDLEYRLWRAEIQERQVASLQASRQAGGVVTREAAL